MSANGWAACCRPAGLNSAPHRVAIALGSNLGDRASHLRFAAAQLSTFLANCRLSPLVETEPVGPSDRQPDYLNAVLVGETRLSAPQLLGELLAIEAARGRTRSIPNAARTLDLDLVLFGDAVIDQPGLRVPHPRFRERLFVLEPLAAIAADLRDPETAMTVAELLARLRQGRPVRVP